MMNKMPLIFLAVGLLLTGCAVNQEDEDNATKQAQEGTMPATQTNSASIEPSATPSPEPTHLFETAKLTNTFGFANEEGKRILSIEGEESTEQSPDEMKEINKAIGDNGQVLTIRYVGHQARTDDDNGRQAAHNFANLEGDMYEIVSGKAVADASYYLIQESKIDLKSLVPIAPQQPLAPPAGISKAIGEAHGREVLSSWLLATTKKGQQIYLVQFERQEDQMLASLAILDEGKWAFMDYPAEYNESSTWRVDDQGEVYPEMFSFLFAAQSAEGMVLGVKWLGAEGENMTVLRQSGDRFVETGIASGRYLSPI